MDAETADNRLVVTRRISIPLAEFTITFSRSGGPGGQNVNKVNTKAHLRWPVDDSPSIGDELRQRFRAKYRRRITREGEFVIASQRFRDQSKNVQDCLDKLRELLLTVVAAPKLRKPTRPTAASNRRRLANKREQAQKKQRRRTPGMDD